EVEQAYRVNRDGAAHLATAALELAVPLLHISTDYVFDGSREGHYLESDTVSPLGVYGQSKWEGEERVREILPNHLILRTSWVFSPHGNNFVKTILRVAAERSELRVVDDQRGAPTSAAGIAGALLQIAEQLQTEGETRWGTYHFSGNPYVTWYDFALEIVRLGQVAGIIDHEVNIHPIPSSEYPTPVTRPSNSALSCERIEQHFGIVADPWIAQLQRVVETLQSR
ncbi:MAG: dTDP-4-dehydrorhamnose reductase, partial [Gammaproteobacteria bacterium]|nr:dTDP-4-dehydrorhamnose reductase [Gammaproteobacteria bacterium]